MDFLDRELPERLEAAREALGAVVRCEPSDLAFVGNATSGVNAVVRSLEAHPETLALPRAEALAAALADRYPCRAH